LKTQRILTSLILTIGLLLANVSTAFAMPPLPSSFYGTVKVNGANAPVGAIVSARINAVEYAHTTVGLYLGGTVYGLVVPGDDSSTAGVIEGGKTGNTVVFYIDGVLADQTGTWNSGSNVSLNLTAAAATNHAPVADAQSISTAEDTAKAITLTGSDADGDSLTYSVVAGPAHGTLSGSAPALTYTPAANYNGSDSFTFKVNDGTVDSTIATVSITVTAVNNAPIITEGASTNVSMSPDGSPRPFSLSLHAMDVDGDILTWRINTPAAHGTASASGTGTSKAISYNPELHYIGFDSFVVQVSDGNGGADTITVNVTISAVEPPTFTVFLPLVTITAVEPPSFTVFLPLILR
jgi:hypothetical protein